MPDGTWVHIELVADGLVGKPRSEKFARNPNLFRIFRTASVAPRPSTYARRSAHVWNIRGFSFFRKLSRAMLPTRV